MLARSCYGIVAVPSAIAVTAIVYFYYYISIVWLSEILPIDLGKDPGKLKFLTDGLRQKIVRIDIIGLVSMLSKLEDISYGPLTPCQYSPVKQNAQSPSVVF